MTKNLWKFWGRRIRWIIRTEELGEDELDDTPTSPVTQVLI